MCNCIKMLNAAMGGENTALDIPVMINIGTGEMAPARMMIATCKRDPKRRGRALPLPVNFCPVCGEKYDKEVLN